MNRQKRKLTAAALDLLRVPHPPRTWHNASHRSTWRRGWYARRQGATAKANPYEPALALGARSYSRAWTEGWKAGWQPTEGPAL